ncbi:hypothetical protein D3C71_2050950 [compost metagenome]
MALIRAGMHIQQADPDAVKPFLTGIETGIAACLGPMHRQTCLNGRILQHRGGGFDFLNKSPLLVLPQAVAAPLQDKQQLLTGKFP